MSAAHLYGCCEKLHVLAENTISASPGESAFMPSNYDTAPSFEIVRTLDYMYREEGGWIQQNTII
jgi:hypothetical protein